MQIYTKSIQISIVNNRFSFEFTTMTDDVLRITVHLPEKNTPLPVEIPENSTINELQKCINEFLKIEEDYRFLCSSKELKEDENLKSQGITNGSNIFAEKRCIDFSFHKLDMERFKIYDRQYDNLFHRITKNLSSLIPYDLSDDDLNDYDDIDDYITGTDASAEGLPVIWCEEGEDEPNMFLETFEDDDFFLF